MAAGIPATGTSAPTPSQRRRAQRRKAAARAEASPSAAPPPPPAQSQLSSWAMTAPATLQDMELAEETLPAAPTLPSRPSPDPKIEPVAVAPKAAKRERSPAQPSPQPPTEYSTVAKAEDSHDDQSKTATCSATASKSGASWTDDEANRHLRVYGRVVCIHRRSNNHKSGCAKWGCLTCSRCIKCSSVHGPIYGCKATGWLAVSAQ